MQAKIKSALMTTGVVLLTVWALRQVGATRSIVDRALIG